MADNLYYLMTILPSLPALGDSLAVEDAMARVREESGENILLLADFIECEAEIEKCAMQHFIASNKDYQPVFSDNIPEEYVEVFMSYLQTPESEWLTNVYATWFDLMISAGDKSGSQMLKEWARWEYSLRTGLRIERLRAAGKLPADVDSIVPEFMKEDGAVVDHSYLIEAYKGFSEPMKAEKFIDQARIDYLRKAADTYTFAVDELVTYLLELRIHNRYARLDPERGRKILEEVTAL